MPQLAIPEDFKLGNYNYPFTITFKGSYSAKQKWVLINNLKNFFRHGNVFYTIEYHKKSDKKTPNYLSPHIHGLYMMKRQISQVSYNNICNNLKEIYGRSQFTLQQDEEEVFGWLNYCMKEVVSNEAHNLMPHKFYFTPEQDEDINQVIKQLMNIKFDKETPFKTMVIDEQEIEDHLI